METQSSETQPKKLKPFRNLSEPDKVKALLATVFEPVSSSLLSDWIGKTTEETDELIRSLGIPQATKRVKLEIQRRDLKKDIENMPEDEYKTNISRGKLKDIENELAENKPDLDLPLDEVVYGDPRGELTLQELNVDPQSVHEVIVDDTFAEIEELMKSLQK